MEQTPSAAHPPALAFVPLIRGEVTREQIDDRLDDAASPSGPAFLDPPRASRNALGRALRVGAPAAGGPPSLLPPVFDTRLWYRAAHEPYRIEDQKDCASCVFIAAASVAQVRAGIAEMEGDGASAASVWRSLLAEHGAELDKGDDAYRAAVLAFCEAMAARGGAAGRTSAPIVPPLNWERFICCEASCPVDLSAKDCYHHQDGNPAEAAFSCAEHPEGVVPHHFVSWVASGVGFHSRDPPELRVIKTVEPERHNASPPFSLVDALQVNRIDVRAAGRVSDQVRRIKTSLMAHGPVMGMMRIDGDSFDAWGGGGGGKKAGRARNPPLNRQILHRDRAGPEGEQEEEQEAARGPNREARAGRKAARAEPELEPGAGEDGEPRAGAKQDGESSAVRRAYRLPEADRFDEYHEVMIVGWGLDDAGVPCWIIQNSYGEGYNCHCAVSPAGKEDWLQRPLARLEDAYHRAGLTSKRGCVFVEMVNADLVASRRNVDIENNVLSFIPVPDRGALAEWFAGKGATTISAGACGSCQKSAQGSAGGLANILVLLVVVLLALAALRMGRG
jgi:hypothetical protein